MESGRSQLLEANCFTAEHRKDIEDVCSSQQCVLGPAAESGAAKLSHHEVAVAAV